MCAVNDTIKKVKTQSTNGRKYIILQIICLKGFVSSYIVLKIINVNNKKTTQLKAQIKDLNKHFSKEDMQWPVST